MCRLLLYMVASLFSLSTVAQTVKISGKVSDEAGDPIEFAGVYTLTGTGGVTDLQGKYSFVAPYQDTIKLVISCMGYHKVTRKIVKPEKEVSLNVVLQTSYRSLQEVTVKELKRETEMVEKLDAKHTRLMPDAAGGSIESLIKTFAGVSSNNEMSSQYMVRGGNYDENSVYVNGIEVYRPLLIRSGQQEGLSFINPDMVRGVNFSAGGFDARYGDKMSSVLDIVYKRPQDFEGSFAASLQGGVSIWVVQASVIVRYTDFATSAMPVCWVPST